MTFNIDGVHGDTVMTFITSLGLNLNMELNCVYLRSKSYYASAKKHGSAMHVAFLDASKAFDRVNRRITE